MSARVRQVAWLRSTAAPPACFPSLTGRGVYYDTHELFNARTEEALPKADWEWADVDGGRIVWAAGGHLLAGRVGTHGLQGEKMLYDLNPMQFEKLAAPY